MRVLAVLGTSLLVAGLAAVPADAGDHIDPSGLSVVTEFGDEEVPEKLRDAYAAYDALTEAYPEDFGYASPNLADGKVAVGVVTAAGSTALTALTTGAVPSAATGVAETGEAQQKRAGALAGAATAANGLTVTTVATERSRAQVERDLDALTDLSQDARFADADVWRLSVERSTGRVIVTAAQLTPALAEAIAGKYGTTNVAVEIAPDPKLAPNIGRLADNHPFWGGARISTALGRCTDAFAWRIGSTPAMVTAGHCASRGGSVSTPTSYMGFVTSRTRENWNAGTGTVTVPGFSGHHGDGAIIQVSARQSSNGSIYRGAYNSRSNSTVRGMWSRRAQSGDRYCTGGSFGGEICGWTVDRTRVTMRYVGGEWARNVTLSRSKTGWCSRDGDSGGSVFTANSSGVTAKGVHSGGTGGGDDNYGGAFDKCLETHTDIWDIYYGLPGYLR